MYYVQNTRAGETRSINKKEPREQSVVFGGEPVSPVSRYIRADHLSQQAKQREDHATTAQTPYDAETHMHAGTGNARRRSEPKPPGLEPSGQVQTTSLVP